MRKILFSAAIIFIVCNSFFAQTVPKPDHVVILMLENYGFSNIIGNSNAPHINAWANDPKAALFTQSYALWHPSQPNYIMLYSGYNQGVTNDNTASNAPFNTCNLGASLIDNGFTFKGYSEDLPSVGSLVSTSGDYARKHCPWTNWQAPAGANTMDSATNLPYTSFPTNTNYDSLPTISFVIPNLAHDMHNPTFPTPNYSVTAISNGDTWVYDNLNDYVNWAKTNNSLLILTFDEDDGFNIGGVSTSTNQITTIFIGQMVQGGSYSTHINHYTVLRTLEDMYTLPYCDSSANYQPIINCWADPTGIEKPEKNEKVNLFPNPASESFTFDFYSNSQQNIKIMVTDVCSKTIVTINKDVNIGNNSIQFSTEKLIAGTYFVNAISSEKIVVKKVVVIK